MLGMWQFFHFNLTLCFKFIFLGQVDKWNKVCRIDYMLVAGVESWSIRQRVGSLVKQTEGHGNGQVDSMVLLGQFDFAGW